MKKLLSFLGTNNYVECHYEYGEMATASRFVQTAIYELFCRDFSREDEVVIFLTPLAKEKNWQDSFEKKQEDDSFVRLEGLENAFRRIAPEANVRLVDISEEQDENNLWELFDRVLNEIGEGDEIIFDMTHGFRSLPIMALAILNYSRLLKKAAFRQIVYGAFEVLGPAFKVKELPVSQRIAPLIDLTPMVKLMDWTMGIDHFFRSGDASLIQELTRIQTGEIFKQPNTTKVGESLDIHVRTAVSKHRILADQLDIFTKSLQTCRGPLLIDAVNSLKERLQEAKGYDVLPFRPLARLLDEVERRVRAFSGDPMMLGYEAAEWCLEHGLIQQGFTFLQEGLFTAVCHVLGVDEMNRKSRDLISFAFSVVNQKKPEAEWRVSDKEKPLLKQYVTFLQPYRERFHWYGQLAEYRNSINHAGYNQPTPPRRFAPQLREILDQSKAFFLELSQLAREPRKPYPVASDVQEKAQEQDDAAPKMFLLFSHSLTEEQKEEAAVRFGVKTFCPLPEQLQMIWSNIPEKGAWEPSWLKMIQEWILSHGKPRDIVLVQGEFGATVYMVDWLRQHGFRPVYATSKRQVGENQRSDGSVETKRIFRHVQFRDYP